nr:MAG TPA: hypothetical protein [Caudoviricetes sp.]
MNFTFTLLCSYNITFHRTTWNFYIFITISFYHSAQCRFSDIKYFTCIF